MMSKMQSTLFICVALACLILETYGHHKQVNFTRRWAAAADSLTHPTDIVKVNDRLFAVTLSADAVIITSIFDSSESKTCDLSALKPDEIFGNIDFGVFTLGNGKIVVRARALDKKKVNTGEKIVGQDLFIIVDPTDCLSLRTVRTRQQEYRVLLAFVPYQNTFDLVYRSRPTENLPNAPQRYNDQGEQVELDSFLCKENEISPTFKIATVKSYDRSAGYIVINGTRDQLVIKQLDSRFEAIMETPIDAFESLSTAHGNITYCQIISDGNSDTNKNKRQQRCHCHFLDATLNTKATVLVANTIVKPEVKPEHARRALVTNLPNGGAVVAVANEVETEVETENYVMQYYLQRIDADRKVRKPVMVTEKLIWNHKMKIFDMENGQICFYNGGETVPFTGRENLKYGAWVHCVNVSDL